MEKNSPTKTASAEKLAFSECDTKSLNGNKNHVEKMIIKAHSNASHAKGQKRYGIVITSEDFKSPHFWGNHLKDSDLAGISKKIINGHVFLVKLHHDDIYANKQPISYDELSTILPLEILKKIKIQKIWTEHGNSIYEYALN